MSNSVLSQWRIQGGPGGPDPPFGLFNIGPKVGPPPFFFACRPKMDPSGGSRVCVCDRGDHPAPPWNVDDVTRTMSKGGGGGACECPRVGMFFKFSGACEKILYPRLDPPPFKNPGSAPVSIDIWDSKKAIFITGSLH